MRVRSHREYGAHAWRNEASEEEPDDLNDITDLLMGPGGMNIYESTPSFAFAT